MASFGIWIGLIVFSIAVCFGPDVFLDLDVE